MNEHEQCGTCRYFETVPLYSIGACRRYAPTTFMIGSSKVTEWPTVKQNDWCGEYELRN